MTRLRRFLLLSICCIAVFAGAAEPNRNLRLGNPTHATADASNKNNYLLVKKQYVLSYNNANGTPNWVSWTLEKSDIGKIARQNNFHPEADLPEDFQHITPADYTGSGYDRGHMCNSKDRTRTKKDNSETFSMANMQPQTPDLNRHVWEKLEANSRKLAMKGNTLYIIAGCYGTLKHIGKTHKVNVPKSCWKLEVVEGPNSKVIMVDIPNKNGISKDTWQKYATTIDDLREKTGLDLHSRIDTEDDSTGEKN